MAADRELAVRSVLLNIGILRAIANAVNLTFAVGIALPSESFGKNAANRVTPFSPTGDRTRYPSSA